MSRRRLLFAEIFHPASSRNRSLEQTDTPNIVHNSGTSLSLLGNACALIIASSYDFFQITKSKRKRYLLQYRPRRAALSVVRLVSSGCDSGDHRDQIGYYICNCFPAASSLSTRRHFPLQYGESLGIPCCAEIDLLLGSK